ncbi:MAG: hypothetical protein CMJ80_00120 [Planctomycetaceae bacterium]|nr:hypothetical protein [Planctomycetaceae bacterium]
MTRSFRITRLAGIDLSVHWTFLLLLGWIVLASLTGGAAFAAYQLALVMALFACVVLHELGHAMAARVFGIPTHGITLLPVGGVAQLDRIPRDPRQEWIIALAGPAVNVVIVGILLPIALLIHSFTLGASFIGTEFLMRLVWMNVSLVVFNLIPAFPMDGGRLLRATLATRSDYVTATRTAKRVGQGVAALLFVTGLLWNPMLMLVAGFVMLAAESEYQQVRFESQQPVARPSESYPSRPARPVILEAYRSQTGGHVGSWSLPTAGIVIHSSCE